MNDEATHTPATHGVRDTQASGSGERAGGTWRGRGGQRGAGGAGLETLQGCDPCWPSAVPVSRHLRIPRGPTAWRVRSRQKCMRFCSEVYRRSRNVTVCTTRRTEGGGHRQGSRRRPSVRSRAVRRVSGPLTETQSGPLNERGLRGHLGQGHTLLLTQMAGWSVKAADVPGPLQSQCTRTLEGEAILRDVETEPGRGFERQRMEAASALDAPWAPAGPVTV